MKENEQDSGSAKADKNDESGFLGDAPSGFTAVRVETGIISDNYVEIISGLSEGQEVYVKDTASSDSYDMFMMDDMGGGGAPPDGGERGSGGPRG